MAADALARVVEQESVQVRLGAVLISTQKGLFSPQKHIVTQMPAHSSDLAECAACRDRLRVRLCGGLHGPALSTAPQDYRCSQSPFTAVRIRVGKCSCAH